MLGKAQAAATAAPVARDVGDPQGGEPATPEEQAQYEEFVRNGMTAIGTASGQVNPTVLQHLEGAVEPELAQLFEGVEPPLAASPVDNLAATAVRIVVMLDESAKAAGKELPDDVVLHGGVAVLEELVEVAEAAGLHEYSEEEIEGATLRAFDLFRYASPRADPEALKQQFGELVAADKQGRAAEVVPGLAARMKG